MTLTSLNLWVLKEALAAGDGVIGQVKSTQAPHLRRCIKAGALEPATGKNTWKLSAAGRLMLDAEEIRLARERAKYADANNRWGL